MEQLRQEEVISSYIDETGTGRKLKQPTSSWAAKIEISKLYSPEEIEKRESEYYNRQRFVPDLPR